jgi:hypothetical protein
MFVNAVVVYLQPLVPFLFLFIYYPTHPFPKWYIRSKQHANDSKAEKKTYIIQKKPA